MPPSSQKTALNLLDFLWYFIKNYYYLHKCEEFLLLMFPTTSADASADVSADIFIATHRLG